MLCFDLNTIFHEIGGDMSKTYNNVIKLDFADYAIIYQRKVVKSGNWYIRIKKTTVVIL